MKRIRYTKFTGDLSSSFGLEDLMQALSDFLLDSGYQDPYAQFNELNNQTMENLREAIREALESGELFDEESQQKFDQLAADQVEELIDQIIQKMQEQNFINAEQPQEGQGSQGEGNAEARFEVTDKSMDFLGYKALRELLGPLGKSNLGRHDTPRGRRRPKPTAVPSSTSSATRSTSTSPLRSARSSPAKASRPRSKARRTPRSTSSTPTSTSTSRTINPPAPP